MSAVKTRAYVQGKLSADGIGRGRDRALVDSLIRAAAAHDGRLTEEVAAQALKETWANPPKTAKRALDIVKAKLKRNPNIRMALADIYEELGDFTIGDAIKKHVEHINDGSYPALKDFLTMTLPMPAKQVHVGMTVAQVGQSMLSNVPAIRARALGPAVVEASPDAQTVEFTEAHDDDA